jgi:hypothetical protein
MQRSPHPLSAAFSPFSGPPARRTIGRLRAAHPRGIFQLACANIFTVMPGPVPGIHVLPFQKKDVDGRDPLRRSAARRASPAMMALDSRPVEYAPEARRQNA